MVRLIFRIRTHDEAKNQHRNEEQKIIIKEIGFNANVKLMLWTCFHQ